VNADDLLALAVQLEAAYKAEVEASAKYWKLEEEARRAKDAFSLASDQVQRMQQRFRRASLGITQE
jgi:hypothetical protein